MKTSPSSQAICRYQKMKNTFTLPPTLDLAVIIVRNFKTIFYVYSIGNDFLHLFFPKDLYCFLNFELSRLSIDYKVIFKDRVCFLRLCIVATDNSIKLLSFFLFLILFFYEGSFFLQLLFRFSPCLWFSLTHPCPDTSSIWG